MRNPRISNGKPKFSSYFNSSTNVSVDKLIVSKRASLAVLQSAILAIALFGNEKQTDWLSLIGRIILFFKDI